MIYKRLFSKLHLAALAAMLVFFSTSSQAVTLDSTALKITPINPTEKAKAHGIQSMISPETGEFAKQKIKAIQDKSKLKFLK